MTNRNTLPFWESKTLAELNHHEWESLCDGCGQCCLVKLTDEDTNKVYSTNVACKLLDIETCVCQDYKLRAKKVAACLLLSNDEPDIFKLLPESCAYRCLHEQRSLPEWHPLISNNRHAVHEKGFSVRDYAVSEEFIHPDQLEDHVISEL